MCKFIIKTNDDSENVAFAYNLIDAIGNKEYFERHGYENLKIVRIWLDRD